MKKLLLFGIGGFVLLILVAAIGFHYWFMYHRGRSEMPVSEQVLNLDQGFSFPPGFPPDPGPAGKKTIEGIDSDHDGVRDDVQRWIYAYEPNDVAKRNALRQEARLLQFLMQDNFDHEARIRSNELMDRAIQCTSQAYSDRKLHGYVEENYLKAKVLNTYARTARIWENDSKYTSQEATGEIKDYAHPCDDR